MYLHYLVICRQRLVLLTLMFHKIVQQHMQGSVGFFIFSLLQIYKGIFLLIFFKNQLRFDRNVVMSLWPGCFWLTL